MNYATRISKWILPQVPWRSQVPWLRRCGFASVPPWISVLFSQQPDARPGRRPEPPSVPDQRCRESTCCRCSTWGHLCLDDHRKLAKHPFLSRFPSETKRSDNAIFFSDKNDLAKRKLSKLTSSRSFSLPVLEWKNTSTCFRIVPLLLLASLARLSKSVRFWTFALISTLRSML